ncbi:Nephrin [Halotydeus destructor]|nr:Nephrin [Halotydeus destructor]
MITLKCRTSSPTIPVTNLLWFHNGDIIRQGVRERVIERDSDFVDDSGGPSLLMTEAIIEVYSKLEEEGSSYKCRANHSGLGDRKLSEEIRLSILYGPGRPEVSGYSKGSDLKAGEKLTLSCLAKGGNPLPSLNWYLEDQLVDSTYSSPKEASSSGETVNGYTFTLKPEDNRRKVRCEASNSMGTQSSDLVLSVHFAPVHIKITGPVAGRINDILRYECLIGPSNPRPSEINWLINGVQYYDGQYPIESWSEETSYGHMSRTNITILLSETIKTVSCIATSPVSQFTASQASVNLNILYPPGEPTISGYTKGKELREGEVLRLKCSSLGGYPIPTIKWLKFIPQSRDEKEIAGLEGKAGHSGATSELLVRVASSDNGATYKCLVFNEVISQPLVTSVVLYPTYFASDYIKVKPTDSVKVRAISPADNVTLSTDVHLECESGECYPYCNMTWYRNGYKMATGAVGDGQEFEEKLSRSTGNFGGQKSLSRLTVKRKWTPYDDGSSFTCAASNMFLPMKKISKSISLHVQYNKSEFSMSNKLYGTKTIGTDLQEDLGPPMTISDATGGDSSHLPLDDSEKKDGAGDSFAFFMPLSSLLLFSLAGWLICFALAMSIVIGRVIKKRKLQVDSQASSSSTTPAKVHAEYEVTATVNGTSRPASICVTTDADGTTTTSSTCKCVIANGDVLGLPTVIQVADGYGLQSPMDMVTSGHVQVVTADAVEGHVTCIDGYCNGNITWYQEGYKVT